MTLQLTSILSDHAVLQRNKPISIRGWAAAGTDVAVAMAGHEAHAIARDDGHWAVELPSMPAGGPFDLTVTAGSDGLVVRDLLIGDVWLCGGQSNMQFVLNAAAGGAEESAAACDEALRCFTVSRHIEALPARDCRGRWLIAQHNAARNFSAVGYYLGHQLRTALGVPIGLVVAASGHTPIEAWLSYAALAADPLTAGMLEPLLQQLAGRDPAEVDLQSEMDAHADAWKAYGEAERAFLDLARPLRQAGKPVPPPPGRPPGPDPWLPTCLYNGMIAPLHPHPIRGVAWYQGETNAIFDTGALYGRLLRQLIRSWREAWAEPQLPFVYVQLARHADVQCPEPHESWPALRQAQREGLHEPATAMVVALDLGETDNIHPLDKQTVGKRLADAALAVAYGHDRPHRYPALSHAERRGPAVHVLFADAEPGLVLHAAGAGFELAGPDGEWHAALAAVTAPDEVAVSAEAVTQPVAVRYAWHDDPPVTLFTLDGRPASPGVLAL